MAAAHSRGFSEGSETENQQHRQDFPCAVIQCEKTVLACLFTEKLMLFLSIPALRTQLYQRHSGSSC